jgi:tripartite-type tricarboxylate transporter receptor subunit TctC
VQPLQIRIILLLLAVVAASAGAQTYPDRAIKLIVPFAVGGNADLIARVIADPLSRTLNQPVIVDNRAGAGGTIGAAAVAQSPPDGYTLLFSASGPSAVAPSIYAHLPYDPLKSFAPISRVSVQPSVIVVSPALGVSNVRELIALAKASPGTLNFGSPGIGTTAHLAGELFKSLANVNIVHIPYKQGSLAFTDLVEGRLQLMFDNVGQFLPFLRAGKLRALAVIGDHRIPDLPDVPTTVEAGLPDFQYSIWFGISAPAGTPDAIVRTMNAKIAETLKQPETRQALLKLNAESSITDPAEFQEFIAADIRKWAAVVKAAGVAPQ